MPNSLTFSTSVRAIVATAPLLRCASTRAFTSTSAMTSPERTMTVESPRMGRHFATPPAVPSASSSML
jgi:hypothetical protein